jgi:aryl-alcohol dehydrogenase-like predicted oxidoreductase
MAEIASVSAAAAGTIDVGGDITVNRVGFGAMRVTGPGIIGEPPDREQAKAVLRRAVELGINFIDTADSYGPHVSENLIAEALYPYPDDLVLATKGGLERPGPNEWSPNGRPEHLRAACEGSLQRLRLAEIPLYQLHRPDPRVPLEESIGALVELKAEGKIRHIGLCNVSEEHVQIAQRVTPIVSVQNRYNVGDRRSDPLVDLCEVEDMTFLPWAPIQNVESVPVVSAIAKDRGVTPRQVALAWLIKRSPKMLPIPGTGTVSHLEENVAAAGLDLSPQEVAAITEAR